MKLLKHQRHATFSFKSDTPGSGRPKEKEKTSHLDLKWAESACSCQIIIKYSQSGFRMKIALCLPKQLAQMMRNRAVAL